MYISVDAKNAFNSFTRQAFWSELKRHFPSLAHLVQFMYGVPSAQIFYEPSGKSFCSVPSSVGSRQGCVLGSFLYCLAQLPVLRKVAEMHGEQTLVSSYADDASFCGPPHSAVAAARLYKSLYEESLQGTMRDDKSLAYSPHASVEDIRRAGLSEEIPFTSEGFEQLGSASGSLDFRRRFVDKKIVALGEEFRTLAAMPSLQAQYTLLSKSLSRRVNHLLRSIPGCGEPGHSIASLFRQLDDHVRRAASRFAAEELIGSDSLQWTLATLPSRHGGLGLQVPSTVADPAFTAAYLHAAEVLPLLHPLFFANCFPALPINSPNEGNGVSAPLFDSETPQAQSAYRAAGRLLMDSGGAVASIWNAPLSQHLTLTSRPAPLTTSARSPLPYPRFSSMTSCRLSPRETEPLCCPMPVTPIPLVASLTHPTKPFPMTSS